MTPSLILAVQPVALDLDGAVFSLAVAAGGVAAALPAVARQAAAIADDVELAIAERNDLHAPTLCSPTFPKYSPCNAKSGPASAGLVKAGLASAAIDRPAKSVQAAIDKKSLNRILISPAVLRLVWPTLACWLVTSRVRA